MRRGWRRRRNYGNYTRWGGNKEQMCRGKGWGNGRILEPFGLHPEWTERHWRPA